MAHAGCDDRERGLYGKFYVERTDGRSAPGEKHDGCRYFVLDIDHDPHAKAALTAYADDCEASHPRLAHDLRHVVATGQWPGQNRGGEEGARHGHAY